MQKRSEVTRGRLLDAALKEFAIHGYEATRVEDICAAADVSKGAFYHHFESKQELFLSLMNSWMQAIDEGLRELYKPTVPETLVAMTDIVPDILTAAWQQLPMLMEFWLQASRDQEVWEASIEPYRHFRKFFTGLVEQGIREGTLRSDDPETAGMLILSMTVGMLLQALVEPQGANWESTAKQGMQVIMKGLAV
ncbi:MAG TPA: TetR/AcrR family transcriptional regulator [Anaerolineales bacterium]|nr:TetR/AcrR family transcriptional regulator [Anaerolineales bacterium]